jgi:hypothetical protein
MSFGPNHGKEHLSTSPENIKQYQREGGRQLHTGDNGNMKSSVNKQYVMQYNIRIRKRKE